MKLIASRPKFAAFVILFALVLGLFAGGVRGSTSASNAPLSKDALRAILGNVTEGGDLAALGNTGVESYVDSLYAAENEMAWSQGISSDLLRDYVVPVRFHPSYDLPTEYYYPELIENWRTPLYSLAKQIIGSTSSPVAAAEAIHDWVYNNMAYSASNQPSYLQPTLILHMREGSCWDYATLLAAFYRSIFLPARIVVGAEYLRNQQGANGVAVSGQDLRMMVMQDFWLSRDWQLWNKSFQVYDETTGTYLTSGEYQTSIKTINNAGEEELDLIIPAWKALNHAFTVTFTYTYPQGHEWVEVWLPGYGWTPTDGESSDFSLGALPGMFDIQAYDPAQRSWVSSNFFYSFNDPIETFLTVARESVGNQSSSADSSARMKLTQAEEYYQQVRDQSLSNEDKERVGEYLFTLSGQASLIALSNDPSSVFLNIWNARNINPTSLAASLMSNGTENIGVMLPYDVFSLPSVKVLYAPLGNPYVPPYVNEVKSEYYWLDSFRSSLSAKAKIFVIILGDDPTDGQWKATLTQLNTFTPLDSALPTQTWTQGSLNNGASSMMFKIDGFGKGWSNFTAIMSKGATQSATPSRDLQAVYAVADGTYLYIMIKLYGQPDPGNNYIIPLDLTGTGKWDYSFGFNANSVWMYDLRGIPNGQWPDSRLSTPYAIYAVAAVAEIAIPLKIIGDPTKIDIADVWIYYPSLGETVDDFGVSASVPFITSPAFTITSSVSESEATTATETSSTNSPSATGLNSPIQAQTTPVWIMGLLAALIVAAIATFVQLRRTKTNTKLERS